MIIRKATQRDIAAVCEIYERVHDKEEAGKQRIGWIRGVYPTERTALAALERGELFVFEAGGCILASAIINQTQVDVYEKGEWAFSAEKNGIMVLHTLTVSPKAGGRGIGRAFVSFYERYAKENGCTVLRMDTNENNAVARAFYSKLGFREAGVVPCEFNGIPGVRLVLLEKRVEPLIQP